MVDKRQSDASALTIFALQNRRLGGGSGHCVPAGDKVAGAVNAAAAAAMINAVSAARVACLIRAARVGADKYVTLGRLRNEPHLNRLRGTGRGYIGALGQAPT